MLKAIILGTVKVSQVGRRKEEAKMQREKENDERDRTEQRQKETVSGLPQCLRRPGLYNSGPDFYDIQ